MLPTKSRRSAGLRTSRASPAASPSPSIGAARSGALAPASSTPDSEARRCSFDRSSPALFARAAPNSARGRAMRGCGAPTGAVARAASTGSAINASTGTVSSPMRFTKEELAPFSSNRRTK